MRRFLLLLLFVTTLLSIPSLAKRFTFGFRLAKMELDFPHHPEWEGEACPELDSILDQPFHFIGKGAQSYVFASKDEKHVVKLFRYDHPSLDSKIVLLFDACKMAYDSLKEETGLVYIHLNPTSIGLPTLQCKDPVGRNVTFPLDRYRFVIQKKAIPFRAALKEAKQNPAEMKKRLDQFLNLLAARTSQGILNTDPNLSRNFGFLEGRAIEFDCGNYQKPPHLDRVAEMKRYTCKLRHWLKKHAPEWLPYLDERVEALS